MQEEPKLALVPVEPVPRKKKGRAKAEFIYHSDFDKPDMEDVIMSQVPGDDAPVERGKAPKGTAVELRHLWDEPLLTREQEQHLFRQYNFLRYKIARFPSFDKNAVAPTDPNAPVSAELQEDLRLKAEYEWLLARSDAVRNRLIQANLRLVIGPARAQLAWYVGQGVISSDDTSAIWDLISDGNQHLMRAVDGFNFARGNKFSTYAIWALNKNFQRLDRKKRIRGTVDSDRVAETVPDSRDDGRADRQADRAKILVEKLLDKLGDPRDRKILRSRFLEGKTLKEVGELCGGITRERVRQLEARALGELQEICEQGGVGVFSSDELFLSLS
ncbi:MAG: sigma-70 family RNA polymerase sigma factor [Candidatus Obscuribacterales bacterium]|nr:sigma-70 family RNA polymerase sigma factor [Candidatus Obscuribacterales bacterium]